MDITTIATPGIIVYALIFDVNGNVWDGSSFVSYEASSVPSSAVHLQQASEGSSYYGADFPSGIAQGTYTVIIYQQSGYDPSSSDSTIAEGPFSWNGSGAADTSAYASVVVIKQFLGITTTATDNLLNYLATVATGVIDNFCRRPHGFNVSSFAEDYQGTDDTVLQLRQVPVTSLTTVTLNAYSGQPVVIPGNQYILDSQTGQIELLPTSTQPSWFFTGRGVRHQVSYSAGFSTIPTDIVQACVMIVQRLYQQASTSFLTTQEKIGDYEATYTLAQQIIGNDFGIQSLLGKYIDFTTGV